MPQGKKKKSAARTRQQKAFMHKALDSGYVPLTPKQVAYFSRVLYGQGKVAQLEKKRAAQLAKDARQAHATGAALPERRHAKSRAHGYRGGR